MPKPIIDIPIAGGIESKVYKALVQPGKSLRCEGVRFDRPGSVSVAPSFELAETESGSICTGLLSDGISIIKTLDAAEYDPFKILKLGTPSVGNIASAVSGAYADVAVYGRYAYVVYAALSYDHVSKVNIDTGESIILLDSLTGARVLVSGTTLYVFSGGTAANKIAVNAYDLTTGVALVGSPYEMSLVGTVARYSVCADGNTTRRNAGYCYFVYTSNSTSIRMVEIHGTSYSDSALYNPGGTVFSGITCIVASSTTDTVYGVGFENTIGAGNSTVHGIVWDRVAGILREGEIITTSSATSSYDICVGCEMDDIFYFFVAYYTDALINPTYMMTRVGKISASVNAELTPVIYGVTPSSMPIVRDGCVYLWVRYTKAVIATLDKETTQQAEYLIRCDVSETTNKAFAFAIASTLEGESLTASGVSFGQQASSFVVDDDGNFYHAAISEPQSLKVSEYFTRVIVLVRAEPGQQPRAAFIGGRCVLSGGFAHEYDGESIVESNFNMAPEIISATSNGGGGTLAAGTTYFKVAYQHVDANNNRHLSKTSLPVSVVTVANDSVTLVVSPYVTGRRNWQLVIYGSIDGINYYSWKVGTYREDGPVGSTESIIISAPYSTTPLIYTSGGVIDNGGAPCLTDVVAHKNRFFGVTPDGILCYTKELVQGYGPEWSPELLIHRLDDDGGRHWQLASSDGQLVGIGTQSIQTVAGDGSNDLGLNGSLTTPVRVPTPNGLVNGSYIVIVDGAVWLQTKSGVVAFTRSNEVDAGVGVPIWGSIGNAVLRGGAASPATNEILLAMDDGKIHVFDTLSRAWSTYDDLSPLGGGVGGVGVDSNGSVWVLNSDTGGLYVSESGSLDYTDSEAIIETPWLRVGSIGGRQRLRYVVVNGEWLSDMTLSVDTYFDFDDTVVDQFEYDYESLSVGDPILFRQHVGTRCSAVKIKLTVAKSDGGAAGACCRLFGLSIELAQKPDLLKASTSHER